MGPLPAANPCLDSSACATDIAAESVVRALVVQLFCQVAHAGPLDNCMLWCNLVAETSGHG